LQSILNFSKTPFTISLTLKNNHLYEIHKDGFFYGEDVVIP
jgi:hypothetical protein